MRHIGSILPPLGLGIIAALVRNLGHEVEIIDGWLENKTIKDLIGLIISKSPDVVGIYTNTSSYFYANKIINELGKTNPNIVIVGGGPHVTVVPKKTLLDTPYLDFVVIGEAENILPSLLEHISKYRDQKGLLEIEKGKLRSLYERENIQTTRFDSFKGIKENERDNLFKIGPKSNLVGFESDINRYTFWPSVFGDIAGIAFRKKDASSSTLIIERTKAAPLIKDINKVPIPAFDLLDLSKYRPSKANYIKLPSYTLITSRGCPYNCSFCSKPFGRIPRFKSAERILQEMKILHDEYGAREIIFEDDSFTLNKLKDYTLFDLIKKELPDLKWSCMTRVDLINREILKTMKRSNCWRIGFGIESGNENILQKMQKGFTKDKVRTAFRMVKKEEISIRAFFILGSLYETRESIKDTIRFAKELNPNIAQFSFFVPYPGTPDFELALKNNQIDPDYYIKFPLTDYHYLKKLVFTPRNMTEEELKEWQKIALKKFYFGHKYIFSQLKNVVHPKLLIREILIALDLFKNII
ncbi:MAG: B12-binding domain-containing radical SAM protein [Promethearchaeota archaeon]